MPREFIPLAVLGAVEVLADEYRAHFQYRDSDGPKKHIYGPRRQDQQRAEADVALLRLEKGTFSYRDCGFGRMDGEHRLSCVMTLRKGNVVWDRDARTTQRWEALPEDYWEVTEVP